MNAISLIRFLRGINQRQLATKVHMAPAYLCQVERGLRKPSEKNLSNLAKALKVPLPLLTASAKGLEKKVLKAIMTAT